MNGGRRAMLLAVLFSGPTLCCSNEVTISPGAELKRLERFVGRWHVRQRVWPPSAPVLTEFKTECEITYVLNGRALLVHERGEQTVNLLGTSGRWEFHGYHTWDGGKRKYINAGFNSLTGFDGLAEGELSADGATLVYRGEFVDLGSGATQQFRGVWESVNPDLHRYTAYLVGPGRQEAKVWENDYTRQ